MTDNSFSVTCPQARATKNRRKRKSSVYQSASWKRAKAAFVEGKACEWCGSLEGLLPHHPWKNTPDDAYEDLYLSECIVLCGSCHFMLERRHKVICPICKENYMPVDPVVDRCWPCHLKQHPEKAVSILEARERRELARRIHNAAQAAKRKEKARKHPCKFHRIRGVCGKSMIGAQCTFSPRKVSGCEEAVMRVRA